MLVFSRPSQKGVRTFFGSPFKSVKHAAASASLRVDLGHQILRLPAATDY